MIKKFKEFGEGNDIYAFFTQELLDRKANQRLKSFAHDAYQFTYNSKAELDELKTMYAIGNTYNGETIVSRCTLNSKTLNQ